jgi:hypothetical protein
MAKNVVAFQIEGNPVYFEADLPRAEGGFAANAGDKAVIEATDSFGQAMAPVMAFVQDVITRIAHIEVKKPTEIEMEFGIKLSGAVNFWVIAGTGEGTINLKLTWKTDGGGNAKS